LADMCNHDPELEEKTTWRYNGDNFEVVAAKDYNAGEQIFIHYGAKPNSFLLMNYGFLLDNNPLDHVPLDINLESTAWLHDIRQDILKRLNKDAFSLYLDFLPGEVFAAWRILVVEDINVYMNESKVQRLIAGKSIGFDYDYLAMDYGVQFCEFLLSGYPTTIQEDDEALKASELGENVRNAIKFRKMEKEIIKSIIKQLSQAMEKWKPRLSQQLLAQLNI